MTETDLHAHHTGFETTVHCNVSIFASRECTTN